MPQLFSFLAPHLPVLGGAALALFVFALIHGHLAELRLPGYILLFGAVAHAVLLWHGLPEEERVMAIIARCILPGTTSLLLCLCLGSKPLRSGLAGVAAYAVICALTAVLDDPLVPVAAGVVALPALLAVHRVIADQLTMDAQSRDILGDSDVVQELYLRGVRPSGYYFGIRRRIAAQANLRMHGVHPVD